MSDKIKELYRKLYDEIDTFGKVCFPTAITAAVPSFHKDIYKYLRDDFKKRVLIASYRGSSKSTLCSLVYPLWKVAFKKPNEDLFIIIVSEAQAQSINFLNRIKYHLDRSDNFKLLFGDMSSATAKRWTQNDIILANGARIMALGTGQKIRGAIEGDTRPNVIILDDIESETNAATAETRVDNRKWITDAVIPSLADNGRIIMVGTVIHEDCFLCWAKESSAWSVLWYGIVDENDVPTWPERFPIERVKQIKEEFSSVGNLNGFYQEYMNIAQAPDTAPFKPSFIRIHDYQYDVIDDKQVLVRDIGSEKITIPVNVYMGIDPASSLSKTADYFVIAVVALDADDNAYLIDMIRERMSPELQPQAIIDMYKKYKPMKTTIEVVGYQEALRTSVRAMMTSQGLFIPGIESGIRPRTSKNERLISLVPRLASGRFYFRSQDISAQQEFLSYPSGKHDDTMDAIFYAIDKSYPCRHRSIVKKVDLKHKRKLSWLTV